MLFLFVPTQWFLLLYCSFDLFIFKRILRIPASVVFHLRRSQQQRHTFVWQTRVSFIFFSAKVMKHPLRPLFDIVQVKHSRDYLKIIIIIISFVSLRSHCICIRMRRKSLSRQKSPEWWIELECKLFCVFVVVAVARRKRLPQHSFRMVKVTPKLKSPCTDLLNTTSLTSSAISLFVKVTIKITISNRVQWRFTLLSFF